MKTFSISSSIYRLFLIIGFITLSASYPNITNHNKLLLEKEPVVIKLLNKKTITKQDDQFTLTTINLTFSIANQTQKVIVYFYGVGQYKLDGEILWSHYMEKKLTIKPGQTKNISLEGLINAWEPKIQKLIKVKTSEIDFSFTSKTFKYRNGEVWENLNGNRWQLRH